MFLFCQSYVKIARQELNSLAWCLQGKKSSKNFIDGIISLKMLFQRTVYITNYKAVMLFNKSTAVFYGLYSYISNDVKKCSELKWNHEPQASGFTAKFWTFYGVILWSIRVQTIENYHRFVFYNNMEKLRAELAFLFVEKARALHLTSLFCLYSYRQQLRANQRAGIWTVIVKNNMILDRHYSYKYQIETILKNMAAVIQKEIKLV